MPSGKPKAGESLTDLFPDVAAQWHPTLNGDLTPVDFKYGSSKKVWWKCNKGPDHEWEATVSNRIGRRSGCPFCDGKRVSVTNSLTTCFPEVAEQWHPTKNQGLDPTQVVAGSHHKYWWKCDVAEDHEWELSPNHRTAGKKVYGCPFCDGKRVSSSNSLGSLFPDISMEWHPTKNGDLTSFDVVAGTEKKFWWKCDKGPDHEWIAMPASRTRRGDGCPACQGLQVSVTNSLISLNPKVASEWHPTKNGELKLEDVVAGSSKKVWWKCDVAEDHEWEAAIYDRALGNESGCLCCGGWKASVTNSVASLYPEVAKQWHPTKNGDVTPDQVVSGTPKRYWWKCDKGPDHEWQKGVVGRTQRGYGCPACAGYMVSVTNRLDLLYPELASQWHPTKNGELKPEDIVAGSTKRVWWKCDVADHHEWRALVNSRTRVGTGCPLCTLTPRSAQEMRIAHELSTVLDFDLELHKIRLAGRLRDVDICIENLNLVIEFDGSYWHRNRAEKDLMKCEMLEAEGWSVIRVRERPLNSIHKNDVMVEPLAPAKEVTDLVLQKITEVTGTKIPKLKEYLASDEPWREKEALIAIREYQAENARKKAERDAKRKQRKQK